MPVDLGLNSFASAVAGAKARSSGYRKAVEDFLGKAGKSDLNEFERGAVITANQIFPLGPGQMIEFAGAAVPGGFLECDGSEVPRANFPELYAAIGDTFGTAAAAANFRLPDLRGASVTGAGGTRVAGPETTVGATHDSDGATLAAGHLPDHVHSLDATSAAGGEHAHGWTRHPGFSFNAGSGRDGGRPSDSRWGTPGVSYAEFDTDARTALAGEHAHAISGTIDDAGSGTAMDVVQPSLAVMMIIKT